MPIYSDLKSRRLTLDFGFGDIGIVSCDPRIRGGWGHILFCQIEPGQVGRNWSSEARENEEIPYVVRMSFGSLYALEVVMRNLASLHREMGEAWIEHELKAITEGRE